MFSQTRLTLKSATLFLLVNILIVSSIQAQDFKDGYIISLAGDTLKGSIKVQEESKAHSYCFFKSGEEIKKYSLREISGYGIYNESAFIKVALPPDSLQAFAAISVYGRASLLVVNSEFYLLDEDKNVHLLTITHDKVTKNGATYNKINQRYKATLSWKLSDCESIKKAIPRTKLTEKSLAELFAQYNECFAGAANTVTYRRPQADIRVGATFGYMESELASDLDTYFKINDVIANDIKKTNYFYAGLNINISRPFKPINFTGELSYTNIRYSAADGDHSAMIEYSALRVSLIPQYNFLPTKKISPFLEIGVASEFVLGPEGYVRNVGALGHELTFFSINFLGIAGAGVNCRINNSLDINFKGRFEFGTSPLNPRESTVMTQRNIGVLAGVSYKLNNKD